MPRALRPAPSLLLAVLLLAVSCAQSRPMQSAALDAPVVSPPAHASVERRIDYWEGRLPALGPVDQAEARLCLGELHLEQRNPEQARLNFYAARNGYLSAQEQALTAYGIGRAFLLEGKTARAGRHLDEAAAVLTGPEGAECAHLADYAAGRPVTADAEMLARLAPYTSSGPGVVRPRAASAMRDGELYDLRRSDWGANALRANHDPMETPFRITVHHTAEPAHTHSASEAEREMRDLQRMHQQGNGWADLGYHFLIDQAGRVIEGRPLTAQGAHAGNNELNRGNLGICLIGNFVSQPDRGSEYALAQAPTPAQMQALDALVSSLQARYGIPNSQIWSHADLKTTACPGPTLQAWVDRKAGR